MILTMRHKHQKIISEAIKQQLGK